MQVILTKDIKGRGKKGDIIDVNPTFATNVLFKQGQAIPATASNLNDNIGQKNAKDFHHQEDVKRNEQLRDEILKHKYEITLKVGANGKAFGSITKQEVLNCLQNQGFKLDKKQIADFEPIRTLGTFTVNIQLMKEVKFNITVVVK